MRKYLSTSLFPCTNHVTASRTVPGFQQGHLLLDHSQLLAPHRLFSSKTGANKLGQGGVTGSAVAAACARAAAVVKPAGRQAAAAQVLHVPARGPVNSPPAPHIRHACKLPCGVELSHSAAKVTPPGILLGAIEAGRMLRPASLAPASSQHARATHSAAQFSVSELNEKLPQKMPAPRPVAGACTRP